MRGSNSMLLMFRILQVLLLRYRCLRLVLWKVKRRYRFLESRDPSDLCYREVSMPLAIPLPNLQETIRAPLQDGHRLR